MLTRAFDEERANAWHAANPVPSGDGNIGTRQTPPVVKTVQSVSAPLAPADQLPISEPEKLAAIAFIMLFLFVQLFMSLVLGHQPLTADVIGAMPSGDASAPTGAAD